MPVEILFPNDGNLWSDSNSWFVKYDYYTDYVQSYNKTYKLCQQKRNVLNELTQKYMLSELSYAYKNCDRSVFKLISKMLV